jgi:josephin
MASHLESRESDMSVSTSSRFSQLFLRRSSSQSTQDGIYHEPQQLLRCALHTLNALLQEPAYDAASLNAIALSIGGKLELAHRWPVLGNYDVNVMMIALQQRGLDVRWWDQRRGVDELRSAAESTACVGLICNEPNSWLLGMVPSRHWLAIRRIRGEWFDLDSRLQAPAKLEAAALIDRLQRLLRDEAGQILVVCQSAEDEDMVRLSGEVSKMSVG